MKLKAALLLILAFGVAACSNRDLKVYSLSEMGGLKYVFRYVATNVDPDKVALDGTTAIVTYTRQFQVTTLNNGAAFATAVVISDVGVVTISEYLPSVGTLNGVGYFDSSTSRLYYTIDLTGDSPLFTIEVDFDGNRNNNTFATVRASRIK